MLKQKMSGEDLIVLIVDDIILSVLFQLSFNDQIKVRNIASIQNEESPKDFVPAWEY